MLSSLEKTGFLGLAEAVEGWALADPSLFASAAFASLEFADCTALIDVKWKCFLLKVCGKGWTHEKEFCQRVAARAMRMMEKHGPFVS